LAACSLPRLHTLDASANALTVLPAAVSQLTSLRALAVRQNRLAGLPAELGGLPQLRSLDARQNILAGLPSALGGMQQLRSLLLDGNRFGLGIKALGRVPVFDGQELPCMREARAHHGGAVYGNQPWAVQRCVGVSL